MPFGLTNAPSTFQCFMNEQLAGLEHCARVYMDDIIVHSADMATHLGHLREVLQCMRDRKLAVKRKKCEFMRDKLVYLGHVVQAGGVSPDPAKVEAIAKLAPPADVSQLRSFLGCCNFYECFVKHYVEIAAPLTDLLGSKVQWVWGAAEQTAFDTLKQALCTAPVLLMPDLRGDFVVDTDASQRSIGGVI